MISFTCPSCQKKFIVPDDLAGQQRKCLTCGATIKVPLPANAERKPRATDADESGEIPLADDLPEVKAQPAPAATPSGLVIVPLRDISLVDFQDVRILDAPVIDAIGRQLYALVDQQARRKIVLDFSKVQFLSSQMLGVIINLHKKSAAIKGRVVLCGLRPDLMKIFTMMKIDKLLRIVGTESEAMEVLGAKGGA